MRSSHVISRSLLFVLMAIVLLTLGACASVDKTATTDPVLVGDVHDDGRAPGDRYPGETTPLGRDGRLTADALSDPSSPLSQRVIYFEFDRDDVRADFVDVVAAHGAYLARNSQTRIRLEGHTDERGTREYNLGLGERRAHSVRRMLLLQGASGDQIQVISYGEEMPAAMGSSEQAWQQNRRVELIYEGHRR
ncbi:peptidoglycan-associated lipoprotein Pal [Ectothiorhodospira lacustris]|uniref:peptidoglycan-associated lipoprotein Pal n=1 Tax=Ectothiorhodospira lacustris TaxID=2899127 RepID=UPI001EE80F04|nr:peptidoglycan-associated lipoprotein Pal [Ectothiorhodospira lacustris]MCG5500922.1 peptidoglycan-associated lipoprotein Pal [Ectothiorhodospira lacustris]MCG5510601.1 peptidoglycan-associated lipoprotein Pal [Ectothiorhodospira lacustris]MCG5521293.1 peptidoglycan-associated lipoprotein Pal [Ectothiorhodospira lacustris]